VAEAVEDPWAYEAEYARYLDNERRQYALALREYGRAALEQAEREALEPYPYEPHGTPYRGLVFHGLAWHWAILRLHRHMYWVARAELQQMPEAYRRASERLHTPPPG
jgi:hypothetical protein